MTDFPPIPKLSLAPPAAPPPGAAGVQGLSSIPLRRSGDLDLAPSGMGGAQAFFVLAAIFGLVTWVLWRQKRARGAGQKGSVRNWRSWLLRTPDAAALRVVQSTQLTQRASVHLLRWDDREWMVGCTEGGMTVLGQRTLAPAPEVDEAEEPA